MMKARVLGASVVPTISQARVAIAGRINHKEWMGQQMHAHATDDLKALSANVTKSSNAEQKVRFMAKAMFARELQDITQIEHTIKMLTGRDGAMDQYMNYVLAERYMSVEGTYNWALLTTDIDTLVDERLRAEGRAAAARDAEMRG